MDKGWMLGKLDRNQKILCWGKTHLCIQQQWNWQSSKFVNRISFCVHFYLRFGPVEGILYLDCDSANREIVLLLIQHWWLIQHNHYKKHLIQV